MKLSLEFFLIIIFSSSCLENNKNEVINSNIFNTTDLKDSSYRIELFEKKYTEYLTNTVNFYNLDSNLINVNSTLISDSNSLSKILNYDFKYEEGSIIYFVGNYLNEFYDTSEINIAWELGENKYYQGLLNKGNLKREDFLEYRNHNIYSCGDYSEYSELDFKNYSMIILHVKYDLLQINYSQIIPKKLKEKIIKKILENVEGIKESYNKNRI